jgi:predicted acetyltransferase
LTVTIRDARNSLADHGWIETVYRDYLADLFAVSMNTGAFPVHGEFATRELELPSQWLSDDRSHPLVILQDQRRVGFAVVSLSELAAERARFDFRMTEFYVVTAARRHRVGQHAVNLIFNRFAGRWEINEFMSNTVAVAFWRRVVSEYTRGVYRERIANGEVQQQFLSANREL